MRYLINTTIIGLIAILGCCQTKTHEQLFSAEFNFPLIIDTSDYKTSKCEVNYITRTNYVVLYIGKWKDSIYPDYVLKYFPIAPQLLQTENRGLNQQNSIEYKRRLSEHSLYSKYFKPKKSHKHKEWSEGKFSIIVDTAQRVKKEDPHFGMIKAYPILIKNINKDTLVIGYGQFLPLITEAKNSLGDWKPIERQWKFICGNGVGETLIPPNEIVLSGCTVYNGSFLTKLRLRMGNNYSNEFNGKINYSQFGIID